MTSRLDSMISVELAPRRPPAFRKPPILNGGQWLGLAGAVLMLVGVWLPVFATSGGVTSADAMSRAYPWGDDPADLCRHANLADQSYRQDYKGDIANCDDGQVVTAPVGHRQG